MPRQERGLFIAGAGGRQQHLLRIRQTVARRVGRERRPVPAVQGLDEGLGVAQAERHVDGLARQRPAAVRLVELVELRRQPRQRACAEGRVPRRQRSLRLLQQRHAGVPRIDERRDEQPAEPQPHGRGAGHVRERGARHRLGIARPSGEIGRLLVAPAGPNRVARSRPRAAEPHQDVGPAARLRLGRRKQQERPLVQRHRVLVRQHGDRAIGGEQRVLDGPGSLVRRRHREVMRDRGEVRPQVLAEDALQDVPRGPMQVHLADRREVVVERLADQVVRERERPRRRGVLGQDPRPDGLRDGIRHPVDVERSGVGEHAEVQVVAEDRRHAQHPDRLGRQRAHVSADQRANLLRDPAHRRFVGGAQPPFGDQDADDLTEEEGIAAGDALHASRDRIRHGLAAHEREVGRDLLDAQAAQRHTAPETRQLAEQVRAIQDTRLALAVRAQHDHAPRVGRRGEEPEQQQRRFVGGVEVVEDDHHLLLARHVVQERRHLLEQTEPFGVGIGGRGDR